MRFLSLVLTLLFATFAQAESKPNVVFILADDLGFGDIESFGQERCQIKTPHFDRLAREGMRFTDAHATASVCVPSRVAIMTGRYAWRFARGKQGGPWGFLGTQLPTDQFTIARLLKTQGYRTGYIGKWHLGTEMVTTDGKPQGPTNVDYTKPLRVGPPQYGFDQSFILPGSLDMYPYVFARNNRWVGHVTAEKGWSAFNRVGPAAEDFDDRLVLDTFSREAERFLRQQARKNNPDEPFFLYLALTAPHTPLSPRKEFEGRSKLGVYGDFVMETDDCVGRVLKSLDRLSLADNTLVIVTSDHGPAAYAGRNRVSTYGQIKELEADGHFSAGEFRGYKFSVYEGAFRVPFVARWPNVVPAGTECKHLVSLGDLMGTLAEITGYELGEGEAPDSHSLLPLLKDPNAKSTRDSMILQATQAMALRSGKWKLAFCPGSGTDGRWGNLPMRLEAWEEAVEVAGPVDSHEDLLRPEFVQLFDLDRDPSESNDLSAKHVEKLRELHTLFRQQVDAGRTTPGTTLQNDGNVVRPFRGVPAFAWKSKSEIRPVRVVIWDERQEKQKQAYENYLGNAIAEYLRSRPGFEVRSVSLDEADKGISAATLDSCDVLIWWGHVRQHEVTPEDTAPIIERIRAGKLSLIALHSAHWSTPFMEAMNAITREEAQRRYANDKGRPVEFDFVAPPGRIPPGEDSLLTPAFYAWQRGGIVRKVRVDLPNCCFPAYRADGKSSTLHVESFAHPIARGLPAQMQIASTEMYGEPFHVPEPDEVIFKETWESGNWFRSGVVWNLGKGRVFYFRPGHETFPVYKEKWPLKILENAVRWLGR